MDKLQKDLEIDEKITGRAGKAFFTNVQPGNDYRGYSRVTSWTHGVTCSSKFAVASVDQMRETIQGVKYVPDGTIYEETWITAL